MLVSSFSVLLPVLFVLALGYFAGRAKEFDTDQVKGINELVLDFALPAITQSETRSRRPADAPRS